jgi:PAS domain S-box-containing protein
VYSDEYKINFLALTSGNAGDTVALLLENIYPSSGKGGGICSNFRESQKFERRFKTIFLDSPVPTSLTRISDNRYIDANVAFMKLIGYERDEIIGSSPALLNLWVNPGIRAGMLKKILKEGRADNTEATIRTKTGEIKTVIMNAYLIDIENENCALGITIDITERKKAEDTVRTSLAEKEALLRELYHRTKNNMQVISAMLGLYARKSTDKYVKAAFKEMENRIFSMSLVHQKLYQSRNLSSICLKEYIEDLTELLFRSSNVDKRKIALVLQIEDVYVTVDRAIPCGLIISELITNSLKHAFADNRRGSIRIFLKKEPGEVIVIRISDDGVGLPAGYNLREKAGLGLQSTFSLIEQQLGGSISYESGTGVSFLIRFVNK